MPPFPDLARHLRPPDAPGAADADLLRRFAAHRDEAAFELLVWRHGGMVLAACRRVLGRSADADDAFQVTFLALARRAGSIRDGAALPGWLHRVARRAAARVRAAAARRPESTSATAPEPAVEPAGPDDVGPVLDEEIDRLPEKLRRAFVLCHLEGLTNEAAAARLGCPKGTVLSRLARARERLRDRLTRRGVVAPALLAAPAAAPLPAALAAATARAAALFAAGPHPVDLPAHVTAITQGVLRAMRLTQLRTTGLVFALAALAAAGLAAAAGPPAAGPPRPAPAAAGAPAQPPPAPPRPAPRVLAVAREGATQVDGVQFSPDGSVVAVTGARFDGVAVEAIVSLWDAATGRLRYTLRGDGAGQGVAFAPDGKTFASPDNGAGAVSLREAATGREVRRFEHRLVSYAAFSPDGRHLVSESNETPGEALLNEVKVWDVATGRVVYSPGRAGDEVVWPTAFAPGGRIVVGTSKGALRVADLATGKEVATLRVADDGPADGLATPDGKSFLLRAGGRPRLIDLGTGKTLREFGRPGERVSNVGLSPDGTRVLGVTAQARVTVWDAATGAERAAFEAAAAKVDRAAAGFTRDGRYVVVEWSTPTADGTDTIPWAAVFTPDGQLVRREQGAAEVVFDTAGRSVVVVTRTPSTADQPPRFDVTVHAAAAWTVTSKKD